MRRQRGLVTKCVTYYWLESDSEKQDHDTLSTWNNKRSYLQVYMGHITRSYFFLPLIPSLEFPQHIQKCPLPFILSYLSRGKTLDISIKMILFLEPLLFPYLSEKYRSDVLYWMCNPNVPNSSLGVFYHNRLRPYFVEQSCNFHISLALCCLIQLSGSRPLLCSPPILWPLSCSVVFSVLLYLESGHRSFLQSPSGSWHQAIIFEGLRVWEMN